MAFFNRDGSGGRQGGSASGGIGGFIRNGIILVVILVVVVMLAKSGFIGGIINGTPVGDAISSTGASVPGVTGTTGANNAVATVTKSADRDKAGIVRNLQGDEYATVVYCDPINSNNFDVNEARDLLNQNNVNWYQFIYLDSRSAPNVHEKGLLFMPEGVTANDMIVVSEMLGQKYNTHVMTKSEYEQYKADSPQDGVKGITVSQGNEMTLTGPAAAEEKQQQNQ